MEVEVGSALLLRGVHAARFKQVIRNLLANAVKFSPEAAGGRWQLSAPGACGWLFAMGATRLTAVLLADAPCSSCWPTRSDKLPRRRAADQ